MTLSTIKVLIPLPAHDFDPSEAAVSWKILRDAGFEVVFATPAGQPASADPLMLSGEGLDVWGFIPGLRKLKLLGLILRANRSARAAYGELLGDAAFKAPLPYADLRMGDFDALLIPGGHAPGMRVYLEDALLQGLVAQVFDANKPVAAICHGVILPARSVSTRTGKSVLHGRKTTALTWRLERSAWLLMRYCGRFWNPNYYRTYPETGAEVVGYRSVQAEVTRALARPEDFKDVSMADENAWRQSSGLHRDSLQDARPAFVVRDGNYVSARWPGDVHAFARTFVEVLNEAAKAAPPVH